MDEFVRSDLSLMEQMTPELTRHLLSAGVTIQYESGQVVHQRADKKPGLSVVLTGAVRIGNPTLDGTSLMIAVFGRGHCFGEITSLIGVPRTHDVIATERTEILQVSLKEFRRLSAAYPKFNEALLRVVATRLHIALERLDAFRQRNAVDRLKSIMAQQLKNSAEHGYVLVRQSDLANLIGVSRVTVGKLLADLELRGVLRREYRRIKVLRPDGLA